MTNETRQKFFSLAHAAVSSMASEESLRDLFDAVLNAPLTEWPKGAGCVCTIATLSTKPIWEYTVASVLAECSDDPPIIVSTQTKEQA